MSCQRKGTRSRCGDRVGHGLFFPGLRYILAPRNCLDRSRHLNTADWPRHLRDAISHSLGPSHLPRCLARPPSTDPPPSRPLRCAIRVNQDQDAGPDGEKSAQARSCMCTLSCCGVVRELFADQSPNDSIHKASKSTPRRHAMPACRHLPAV